jgi:hypothetical protein
MQMKLLPNIEGKIHKLNLSVKRIYSLGPPLLHFHSFNRAFLFIFKILDMCIDSFDFLFKIILKLFEFTKFKGSILSSIISLHINIM